MLWIILLFATIGVACSVVLYFWGLNSPLTIGFSHFSIKWCSPISVALVGVMIAFVLELVLSMFVRGIKIDKLSWVYWLVRFIENGLFIPLFSMAVSYFFERKVESLNLDYLPLYSEKVSKVCFSVIVITFCIVLKIGVLSKYTTNDWEFDFFLNRILMWMLTVMGTWLGLGCGCRGRVARDNDIIQDSNSGVTFKDKIRFWTPIIVVLMICDVILFLSISKWFEMLYIIFFPFSLTFLLTSLIALYIIKSRKKPSERRSLKNFCKAKECHAQKEYGEGQYCEIGFCLDKNELVMKERRIIYQGHQDDTELKELFGEKRVPLDTYEDALVKLQERCRKQNEYIKKAFEDCIEIERNKKRIRIQ